MKLLNLLSVDTVDQRAPAPSDASVPPLSTIATSTGVAPNGTFVLKGEPTDGPPVSVSQATAVIGGGWLLTCLILSQGNTAVMGAVCADTWLLFLGGWVVLLVVGRGTFSGNCYAQDRDWPSHDADEPLYNVDGTPMCGDSGVDVMGKPYGVIDSGSGISNDD